MGELTSPTARPVEDLLERAPCGFISFGDDARVTIVNATLLDRLGYTRDELVGHHVEAIFTVAGRLFFQTHFFPLVRLHGRVQEVFLLLRSKSGEDIGALCNAVRHAYAGVVNFDCVLLEVIERRKYEDALLLAKRSAEAANRQLEEQAIELEAQHQQMQDQAAELEAQTEALQELNEELVLRSAALERQRAAAEEAQRIADVANRTKSDFLAVMSHELRTPLNAIGGYTQLIEAGVYGPVSGPQVEALGRIVRSQRHLLGLINDVLNMARIETGRVDYAIDDIPVPDVVAELTPMIEPQLAAKGIHYSTALPDDPVSVRADRDKLVQILLNLVSNAIKFTANGGDITVRCALPNDSADRVIITVSDTGRGIPADKLEAIFEPFVQVRSGRTGPSEGTGLGLAISRNLARGMGGDLTAASEFGKGSTFRLTLERSQVVV